MKQLLVLLMFLCSTGLFAQDVIVKRDGSTILCRVMELTPTEIVYKKWTNLKGANYVMDCSLVSAVNYENGKKVSLSKTDNMYKPNNQNDGVQQYNDRTLLMMDADIQKLRNKIKTLRVAGLVGGLALVGGGVALGFSNEWNEDDLVLPVSLMGCGVALTTTCFIKARKYEKQASALEASSLYYEDFKLKNGTLLTAGLDMLSDKVYNQNVLGIGLRCYF